ncbi:MAG: hypothetical protein HY053_06000 [Proteobacteria bacterium]|nr:hypothetical protein [Pseudomonadota bacterium]
MSRLRRYALAALLIPLPGVSIGLATAQLDNNRADHLVSIYGRNNITIYPVAGPFLSRQFEGEIRKAVCAATNNQPPANGFVTIPSGQLNQGQRHALLVQMGGANVEKTKMTVSPAETDLQRPKFVYLGLSDPTQNLDRPDC